MPPSSDGTEIALGHCVEHILICSHNPIFIKNLYAILREEGLGVDLADHHSLAITMVLKKTYIAVIIDAEQLGLSAEEVTRIIKGIRPDAAIIIAGGDISSDGVFNLKAPVDLEEFKELIQTMNRFSKISHN